MASTIDLTLPASSTSSSALSLPSNINKRKSTSTSSKRDADRSPCAIMDFVDMTASPPAKSLAQQKSGTTASVPSQSSQQRDPPKAINASSLSALQAAAVFKVPSAKVSAATAASSSSSKSQSPLLNKTSTPTSATSGKAGPASPASSFYASSPVKGSSVKRPSSDSTNEASGSGVAKIKKSSSSQNTVCHHHQTACPSKLLRCTFIRPNGQRCQLQYCTTVLAKVYNIDRQLIVEAGRNRYGVDPRKHCSSAEARYLWACPRCRKTCQCKSCREKAAEAKSEALSSTSVKSGSSSTHNRLAPPYSSPQRAGGSSLSVLPAAGSKSAAPKDAKSKPLKSKTTGSSSGSSVDKPSKASISSSSKPAKELAKDKKDKAPKESKTATKEGKTGKNGKTAKGSKKQQHAPEDRQRPSIFELAARDTSASTSAVAPSIVPPGEFQPPPPIKPSAPILPPLKVPKLPKFGVPEMLTIETKLPLPNIRERIWIYETLVRFDCVKVPKQTLSKLDRFEEWTERMVQTMLEHVLKTVAGLDNINNGAPKRSAERAVRSFRRYGKELQRGEPWEAVRLMCEAQNVPIPELLDVEMNFNQRADSPDEQVVIGQSMLAGRSTRARRNAELAAVERVKEQSRKEVEGHVDTDDESDDDTRCTRVDDGYDYGSDASSQLTTPDISGKPSNQEDEEDQVLRSIRTGRPKAIADASDEEFSVDSPVPPPPRRSMRAPPDAAAAAASAAEAEPASPPAPPVVALPFEQRVAILSAAVQLLLQTPPVGEEFKLSIEEMTSVERETREEVRTLEKTHAEWLEEFTKTTPNALQIEELAKWTAERKKAVDKHQKKLLDARVRMHVQLDALKLRTGPLGFDVDGNEYWQLSEFVERKPASTAGRWAWSLIVFGQPFPTSGAAPGAADTETKSKTRAEPAAEPLVSIDVGGSGKDGARELSPLTDIDDDGDAEMHDGTKKAKLPDVQCLCIDGQDEIARTVAWIEFRKQRLDYEENVKDRIMQANENVPADVRKQRKERLETQQAERAATVKALVDKLKICRQYYQWHTGDTSAPEPRAVPPSASTAVDV